jgi:hypothetical protein
MPEERRHVYPIFRDIVNYTKVYLRGVEELPYPGFFRTSWIEECLARSAFHLLQCFDEFEQSYGAESPPVIPLRVERSLKAIRGIVSHQIDRWGWSYLKRPDGKAFIAEHLQRHHDRKELPYLRALLTWRLAENIKPHGMADDEVDRARMLGIVPDPDLTPDQAKSLTWELHEKWCRDAALGDAPPNATQEEENELASHCDSVNSYFQRLVSPAELIGPTRIPLEGEQTFEGPADRPPPRIAPTIPPAEETKAEEDRPSPLALGGPDDEPIVLGRRKPRLNPGQYRVVKALLDAYPDRLSKDTLARRSGAEDPIGMIDRLRRDEDWAAVLDKPGKAHGGYGIRKTTPTKT